MQLIRQVYERFSHMLTTFDTDWVTLPTIYPPTHPTTRTTSLLTHTTVVVLATTHVHAHVASHLLIVITVITPIN